MGGLPLVQQHTGPHALEANEAEVAELAAIERHLEQPGPAGQARAVQQLLSEAGHLEEELALPGIPVEGHQPVVALEAGGALGDRRRRLGGRRRGWSG